MDTNEVIFKDNEPRVVLNEDTMNRGYLELEDARALLTQSITAYCEQLGMKRP